MTTFYATIHHHSIASAPVIRIDGSLDKAKRLATKAFGDGFLDHKLCIYGSRANGEIDDNRVVAWRKLGERRWHYEAY